MSLGSDIVPGEALFSDFRRQCLTAENWVNKFSKNGMEVWVEVPPLSSSTQGKKKTQSKVHKIKCKMAINDVPAATMYDVLHDNIYRKNWDPAMLDSFEIARLAPNADVGYYSWKCPQPLKNRDVVTIRSWRASEDEYLIVNYSVKHPKFPPSKDFVRAVSFLTGYMVIPTGPNSCSFIYLSEADPKGFLPKWAVNKATQVLAPKVMKCMYKAGQEYRVWKEQHSPEYKPWLYPIQSELPMMDPSELRIQRGDSLENVDESSKRDAVENEDSS